jgi:hypothetical protein
MQLELEMLLLINVLLETLKGFPWRVYSVKLGVARSFLNNTGACLVLNHFA